MPRDRDGVAGVRSQLPESTLFWGAVMWKKWLAFAGILTLIILLDPTHTPAQPGGKGFGKGGPGGPGSGMYPSSGGPGSGFGRPRPEGGGTSAFPTSGTVTFPAP